MTIDDHAPRPPTGSPTPTPAAGEPALLFLPGWCGDRTVFDGLLARLGTGAPHRRRGPARARGVAAQRDGLQHRRRRRRRRRPGRRPRRRPGRPRRPLARRLGGRRAAPAPGCERVPGIVLLDWMVLGTPPGFDDALAGLQDDAAWADVRAALFGMWTQGVDEPAVHEYVASMGEYGAALLAAGRPRDRRAASPPTAPAGSARRARRAVPDPAPLRPAGRRRGARRPAGLRRDPPVVRGAAARRPQPLPDVRGARRDGRSGRGVRMSPALSADGGRPRLVVVVAHPDDETFGTGSVLLHAAAAGIGDDRRLRHPRGGRRGHPRQRRRRRPTSRPSARASCAGPPPCSASAGSRCSTSATPTCLVTPVPPRWSAPTSDAVRDAVRALLEDVRPDVVVTLDAGDGHRDHAASATPPWPRSTRGPRVDAGLPALPAHLDHGPLGRAHGEHRPVVGAPRARRARHPRRAGDHGDRHPPFPGPAGGGDGASTAPSARRSRACRRSSSRRSSPAST